MNINKRQFIAIFIIFFMGFSFESLLSMIGDGDYMHSNSPSKPLRCTVDIDCDTEYELGLFLKQSFEGIFKLSKTVDRNKCSIIYS